MNDCSHPLLARLPLTAGPVRLRALRVQDLQDFLAYRSDAEVARFQGWQPMDEAAALAFLQSAAPEPWEPGQAGEWAQIGIASQGDDRLVGDIGLLREAANQVQIGFTLARPAQGRGWALAALRACTEDLLLPLGIRTVRAITDERNAASRRLLWRLGFEGAGSEVVLFRGETCTELTFHKRL